MILPHRWILRRPGMIIPVFFLSLLHLQGQFSVMESGAAALGKAFVTRSGDCMAMHNQAGLGQFLGHSISLQHSRPGLCPDLGISVVSAQLATSSGALAATLTHYGVNGLGYTSAWLAYGLGVHKHVSAGAGIHFWKFSIGDKWMHHPGFSFAVGIQASVRDNMKLAAHVAHPAGWYAMDAPSRHHPMTMNLGGSWTMVPTTCIYLELESTAGQPVRWKLGVEWKEKRGIALQFGVHSQPLTVSFGTRVNLRKWNIQTAFAFAPDAGTTPYSALTYEW